ncbi:MAG: protein kinase [Verrucomicrobiae bacterium]|nr:protein kinase [Verrucomicrobiae bacterium]
MALLIDKGSIDKNFEIIESADAEKGLQELSKHYSLRDGTLKPGTLRLVKNWDGTIQLKRTQWYHFWNSSLFGTRDTSRAETYVKSLLSKAYPTLELESHISRYQEYPYYQKKIEAFKNFCNSEIKLGPVTIKDLSKVLFLSQKFNVSSSSNNEFAISNPQRIDVKSNNLSDAITKCLDEEGITLHGKIGAGAMGFVYGAEVKGDNGKYVFKTEKKLSFKNISNAEGLPFHQRGDLAASCLKELQHMTKPIFVIVALQKTGSPPAEYHYLPAMEAESFVKEIAQDHPNAKAAIAGQLMELAPGRELFECIHGIKGDQVSFNPSEKPFKQVMQGLFTHMEIAMQHNYLHRDIKAENVMINKNAEGDYEVRFIDGGFAAYGGREGKRLGLTDGKGTPQYVSPRVVIAKGKKNDDKPYGAEVDFYSTGMLLLEMIDPVSFDKVHRPLPNRKIGAFFEQQIIDLQKEIPPSTKNYLDAYLVAAGTNSTVSQKLQLEENKSVKTLIDLSFEASKEGESGQAAFEQWETAFEQWKQENSSVLLT